VHRLFVLMGIPPTARQSTQNNAPPAPDAGGETEKL